MSNVDNQGDSQADFVITGPRVERIVVEVKKYENDPEMTALLSLLAEAAAGLESAGTSIKQADIHINASKDAVKRLRSLKAAA